MSSLYLYSAIVAVDTILLTYKQIVTLVVTFIIAVTVIPSTPTFKQQRGQILNG